MSQSPYHHPQVPSVVPSVGFELPDDEEDYEEQFARWQEMVEGDEAPPQAQIKQEYRDPSLPVEANMLSTDLPGPGMPVERLMISEVPVYHFPSRADVVIPSIDRRARHQVALKDIPRGRHSHKWSKAREMAGKKVAKITGSYYGFTYV